MTKTKRRRLLVENGPIPGDVVAIDHQGQPWLQHPRDHRKRIKWNSPDERLAMVLYSTDDFISDYYDWVCLITLDGRTVGWMERKYVRRAWT